MRFSVVLLMILTLIFTPVYGAVPDYSYAYLKEQSSVFGTPNETSSRIAYTTRSIAVVLLDYKDGWYKVDLSEFNISESWVKKNEVHTDSISEGNLVYLTEYKTKFSAGTSNRNSNMVYAGSKTSVTIPPGGEFNFNQLCNTSADDVNYKMATILVNGKQSTGIGGGICQVSSTIYNSVLDLSGVSITERHKHSAAVGYVPVSKDATVSRGTKNFKFLNERDRSIVLDITVDTVNGVLVSKVYEQF